MQVSAAAFGQRVTINQQNISLRKVLKEIRKQSGYDVIYNTEQISPDRNIANVAITSKTVDEALDIILPQFSLTFELVDKNLIIKEKQQMTTADLIDVKGIVEDAETGKGLYGAKIRIKGSNKVTFTNENGEFTLLKLDKRDVLQIDYIGYITKEIKVARDLGKIKLEVSVNDLDAVSVVNTGYQRIKPTQVTGAISTLGTREYESRISTDFASGLINKLPGLTINSDIKFTSSTYSPTNKNGLFNIRGLSTITGNQNPLIVLDGYPTELLLNDINPNEIGSVTILKDAAAAAIYGVRAANGVVIIERKQAVAGKPRFAFRTTIGVKPKEDYSGYRWAPGDTYTRYLKALARTPDWNFFTKYGDPLPDADQLVYKRNSGIITQEQMDSQLAALTSYNNNEDYSRLFTRDAFNQQYNLNVSGGSENVSYYFTVGYLNNSLNQIKSGNRQFQLTGRTTFKFSKRLSLELTTEYIDRSFDNVPVPDISQFYPYERFQDAAGNPATTFQGSNTNSEFNKSKMALGYLDNMYYPLVDVNEINNQSRTVDNRFTGNFKYLLNGGFKLNFGGIYESSTTNQRNYAGAQSSVVRQNINYYTNAATNPFTLGIPNGGYLQQTAARLNSYTFRVQLDFNKNIGKDHSINAILGSEIRGVVNQSNSSPLFGYNDNTLISQPVDYKSVTSSFSNVYYYNAPLTYAQLFNQQYTDDRYLSGYFNIVYAFKEKYSVTSSIRIDQSNLFGQDPKYRYKPLWSLGAAWNVNKEGFMKNADWITSLKLRIAEGLSGNVAKASLPQIVASSTINYVTPSASEALSLLTVANSGLRWEKTNNFNIGVDYALFNRINGSVDYYIKKSSDLLGNTQIDATKGVSSALVNQASIKNQGLEINLHADWISRKNFNWNTGFAFAKNTSKVLDVYQDLSYSSGSRPVIISQMANGYIKGYPIGQQFSFRYAGLNNKGIPLVYDPNGNVVQLNTNTNPGTAFLKDEGSYIPKYNMGLSNRVDIGNFYVYAMVNFYTGFRVRTPYPTPSAVRPIKGSENFWQKAGDELNPGTVMGNTDGIAAIYYFNITPYLDTYTVNGAYMTLGDLTASYNLGNTKFIKNFGFSTFELKLQASNVYTLGFNRYNYSQATGSFAKNYLTPTYTIGLFTNF